MDTPKLVIGSLLLASSLIQVGCRCGSQLDKEPLADWTLEFRETVSTNYELLNWGGKTFLAKKMVRELSIEKRSQLREACISDLFNPNQHPHYRVISAYTLDAFDDRSITSRLIHLLMTEQNSGVRDALSTALAQYRTEDVAAELIAASEKYLRNDHYKADVAQALRNKPFDEVKAWLTRTGMTVDDARGSCLQVLMSFNDPSLISDLWRIVMAERNPKERQYYESDLKGFVKSFRSKSG